MTDTSTTGRAQQVAGTATDEGKHVAGVAAEQAQNVASTAAEQARSVAGQAVGQVRDQLTDQATTQRDNLAGTLRSFGDDLERMATSQDAPGLAKDLAREVSDRARALGSHLEGREPGQLLDDVRDLARRRPGTFLLGALAAGVVAGRLLRATADGAAAAQLAQDGTTTTPAVPATAAPTTTGVSPVTGGGTGSYPDTGGLSGSGAPGDPLSEPPTVSSGQAGTVPRPETVAGEQLTPPMPSSTPGQRTMDPAEGAGDGLGEPGTGGGLR
jgi:hypothetical protein